MKKLFLILALFIPTTLLANGPTVDYYDLQHFKIVPATNTNRNDWYMRGTFNVVKSTWIVDAADCPIVISFTDDGVITGFISSATFANTASTATVALNAILWKTIGIDTTTLVVNDLFRFDGTNFVRVASGTVVGTYLCQDFTWGTPSGACDMSKAVYDIGDSGVVDDSEALNGEAYAHFVNTSTVQAINGTKTFNQGIAVSTITLTVAVTRYFSITAVSFNAGSNVFLIRT